MHIGFLFIAVIFFVIDIFEGRFLLVKVDEEVGSANLLGKEQSDQGNYDF